MLARLLGVTSGELNTDESRAEALISNVNAANPGEVVRHTAGNVDLGSQQIGKAGVTIDIAPRVRVITTAATGIWNGLGSINWPYTYKVESGLRRWFNSLGQVTRTTAGLGAGGVDVVCIGDSLTEFGIGSTAANQTTGSGQVSFQQYLTDKWSHLLKVLLQDHYNPPGILGGHGYTPTIVGSQTLTPDRFLWAQAGTWSNNTLSGFASHSSRNARTGFGANSLSFEFDGSATDAVFKRLKVDSFEVSGRRTTSNGTIRYDVGEDSLPAIGAGGVTGTINTNGADAPSVHWGRIGAGSIDPDADNFIQIAAPELSGEINCDGVFLYNGDWDCGVRVHNVGAWGNALVGGNFETHKTGILELFTATPTDDDVGAKHGKLAIVGHIGNDVKTGNMVPHDQFKAGAASLVEDLINQPSKPCVLWWIPTAPFNNGPIREFYQGQIEALYEVADEHDHMAIINFEAKMLQADTDNGMGALGGYVQDETHYSNIGHKLVAEDIFRLLVR